MAEVFRTVRGQPLEEYVMTLPGVARAMRRFAFELEALAAANLEAARAESLIEGRRFDDDSRVRSHQVNRRTNQWEVELDDSRGDGAAGNIEEGRIDYVDRETGQLYGGMDGLFILGRAIRALKARHRRSLRG